jgi:glucose-6-phosphate dehydrogenase assembly protein OpcA
VITELHSDRPHLSCQRLFIVEGAATAVVSIIGFFLLPNTPLTTWWLSEREKELAHGRMERDKLSDASN